jgi:TolB-like protein
MLMSMPTGSLVTFLAATSVLLFAACAGSPTVSRPTASRISEIKTVAVLPFENLASTDRQAAERVQQLVFAEMRASDAFEVIEPGLVAQTLADRTRAPSALAPEELKALGASLRADGILIGAILSYTDSRGADGGEVTLQLRLVETRSGATVWVASHSRKGSSFAKRLFGLASDTGAEVAREVIRSELATLPR